MSGWKSEHLMVVAMDLGTTYSGYAFSLGTEFESEPTKISSNTPWIASQGLVSHKTPTCVLLSPEGKFLKFGYEAEDAYNDLAENQSEDHKMYYYFRRFKMVLHTRAHLQRETTIEDETGKPLSAMTVFVHAITYLKDHALKTINNQGKSLDVLDIHWVLTVPAIWSDAAKQFMREAAEKAGIERNNLSIALEPEAASVYCKHLPNYQQCDDSLNKSLFKPSSKYMVIDLGGGTADITVHRVESDNTLCEIHAASGGSWGGTKVDEAFMEFLRELFGDGVMKSFIENHMEDAIDLYREFELRKRKVKLDMSEFPTMAIKIPVVLFEVYKEKWKTSLKENISTKEKYKDKVTCTADKLKVDSNIMKSFFKKPLEDLVEHIREILAEMPVRGTNTFIMVGGFSESEIVQQTIRAKFPNMNIIIPTDAGLTVLKGAVVFGHAPMMVTSRMCRRTYGMAVSKPYVQGRYPEDRCVETGGRKVVRNVFHKYAEMGQAVKVGESITLAPLTTSRDQRCAHVRIFSSKSTDPEFVTDKGCNFLGEIVVDTPKAEDEEDSGATVYVKMTFGGTELVVKAETHSGKTYVTRFDFLCGH